MCGAGKRIRWFRSLLLCCILLSGCGNSSQPVLDIQEDTADEPVYRLTGELLPDPQAAITEEIWEDDTWTLREEDSCFLNGRWSLLSRFYIKGHGTVGACVQILSSSCDSWESYGFLNQEMVESIGGTVNNLAGMDEDGILLELELSEKEKHLLGRYCWDGTWEPLMELPETMNDAIWYQTQNGLYAASSGSRTMMVFDQELREQNSRSLSGKVVGLLENPADNTFFWYGFELQELVLWDSQTGAVSRRVTDQINPYSDFCMAFGPVGELLLADTKQVWLCGDGDQELRELFSFMEMDYPLDAIYGCSFQEDGTMQFLAGCDGEKYLLMAKVRNPDENLERQEITIAVHTAGYAMEKLVARYNRQSEKYYVTFLKPDDGEDWADFLRRLQLEMTAGRGPDLIDSGRIDVRTYVSQGYLEPLDWIVEDMSPFHESAFLTGRIEGVLYSIPYSCQPRCLMVSEQITNQSSWTLEEMMEAVRNSPAEVLEYGQSGTGIVMYYGLYDEENKALIDWEAGVSHLREEPFLELLTFAGEYADNGQYAADELMDLLRDGTIAAVDPDLWGPGTLNKLKSCYGDEGIFIGYPRTSGNGIYMSTYMFCMNRNTASREGAADFLRYLLSDEGQRKYAEYGEWDSFSVRRSVNEYCLEQYQRGVKNPPSQHQSGGFFWEEAELDEKQISQYWQLLDNAGSGSFRAQELQNMVYEELQPYFSGDRSAEEAAAVLDSRVQLYLNERQ